MGLDFASNHTYNNYVKYFPEHNSMVVFTNIYNNSVLVYRLTKAEYEAFNRGDFALSFDGKGHGKTPTGHPVKNASLVTVYSGLELGNRKELKKYLDKAELIAQYKKEAK